MSDANTPGELKALESGLRGLVPAVALDRDALMFRAGQESMRRGRWTWPTLAAASWLLTVALGSLLATRAPVEHVVYVEVPKAEPAPVAAPLPRPAPVVEPSAYLKMRYQVLHDGVDSLPPPPPVPLPVKDLQRRDPTDF
jgi:hypothetical protein